VDTGLGDYHALFTRKYEPYRFNLNRQGSRRTDRLDAARGLAVCARRSFAGMKLAPPAPQRRLAAARPRLFPIFGRPPARGCGVGVARGEDGLKSALLGVQGL
jgi:hypothetical protein